MKKINISEKLSQVTALWTPHVIAELNGQHVRVARIQGEFVWHKHDDEDELFYVVKGTLRIQFEGSEATLNPGELIVVPRGTMHKPIADEECELMLFEPASTLNTGNAETSELTKKELPKL